VLLSPFPERRTQHLKHASLSCSKQLYFATEQAQQNAQLIWALICSGTIAKFSLCAYLKYFHTVDLVLLNSHSKFKPTFLSVFPRQSLHSSVHSSLSPFLSSEMLDPRQTDPRPTKISHNTHSRPLLTWIRFRPLNNNHFYSPINSILMYCIAILRS